MFPSCSPSSLFVISISISIPRVINHLETLMMHFMIILLLFKPAAEACEDHEDNEDRGTSSTEAVLLCRTCGHELSRGTDIHFVPSRLALSSRNHTLPRGSGGPHPGGRGVHTQMFQNPHGLQFEVMTFRKADVTHHWPAEKHFSWFPGFSWTVSTCPRCKTHLGWGFQPSTWPDTITTTTFEESEETFLALITHRLLSEDFASSLLVTPKSFMS
ncbi:uncharacterized protein si:ch211-51h9.7 [Labrus mixtus]|uniref:uncharacterized protein si:ch211-51h9.7 n=1 Tax=Labrus mixtus TaxID=508554 RepID=UPI0029C0A99F|nr:uncharacterized protein si:ch211-51h9.7 [Labrus mixtus]XP_060895018.1 uncharacterized protein si:ch211-51h9.7 [Labrus mixtus]